ncbi:transposase family protein [Streptomyces alboniger]|uniref:transposase family protein n=1 Tax=Streptomyces alboniger TaxID=132473 RepID=UPI001AD7541E|nr:transposase family protein [Streptomyces alboniger]
MPVVNDGDSRLCRRSCDARLLNWAALPARCPSCAMPSWRVHGRYVRHLADAPIGGAPVFIEVVARRFECLNAGCPAVTFVEQIEGLRAAGLAEIADLGLVGLDDGGGPDADPAVITGFKKPKGKQLSAARKLVDQLIAAERAVCEHTFAHLKNWRVLTRLRLDVKWPTWPVRALMILTEGVAHELASGGLHRGTGVEATTGEVFQWTLSPFWGRGLIRAG